MKVLNGKFTYNKVGETKPSNEELYQKNIVQIQDKTTTSTTLRTNKRNVQRRWL